MIIYGLSSSGSPGVIRYVGRTVGRLKSRLSSHVWEARHCPTTTHKARWIRSVLADGHRIEGVVLAWAESEADLDRLEIHYIAQFRALGFALTNITTGGDGVNGMRHSPETRAKLSAKLRGHPSCHPPGWKHTPASRELMSAKQKGRKKTPAEIEKQRLAHLGQTHSAESKRKMSAARLGKVQTPEHRRHLSEALTGRTFTPEWRAKIGEANKLRGESQRAIARAMGVANRGKKRSAESRAKQSATCKGRPRSPEHTEKLRALTIARNIASRGSKRPMSAAHAAACAASNRKRAADRLAANALAAEQLQALADAPTPPDLM